MTDSTEGATPPNEEPGLEAGGVKALREERRFRREAESEAKGLREELATLQRSGMVSQVASEKSIPPELAERLRGDTREEIEADADAMLAAIAPKETTHDLLDRPKEKLRSGASSVGGEEQPDASAIAAQILR